MSFVDMFKAEDIIWFCCDNIAWRGGVVFLIGNTYIPIYWIKLVGLPHPVSWNSQLGKWSGHRSKWYWEWGRFSKLLYLGEAQGRIKPLVGSLLLCQTGLCKIDKLIIFSHLLLLLCTVYQYCWTQNQLLTQNAASDAWSFPLKEEEKGNVRNVQLYSQNSQNATTKVGLEIISWQALVI